MGKSYGTTTTDVITTTITTTIVTSASGITGVTNTVTTITATVNAIPVCMCMYYPCYYYYYCSLFRKNMNENEYVIETQVLLLYFLYICRNEHC